MSAPALAYSPPLLTLPDPQAPLLLEGGRKLVPRPRQRASMLADYKASGHQHAGIGCWEETSLRGIAVIASLDSTQHGTLLHLSISYPHRLPDWNDVKAFWKRFFPPDVDCALILPREGFYVNLMPHCHHIWQLPLEWGVM